MDSALVGLLAIVLSPITGVIAALLVNRRAKEKNENDVEVSGQEANTHEFAVLTQGYQASYSRMEEELSKALSKVDQLGKDLVSQGALTAAALGELEKANRLIATLSTRNYSLTEERTKILLHLSTLESLVPSPPGPPPRPGDWHLTTTEK